MIQLEEFYKRYKLSYDLGTPDLQQLKCVVEYSMRLLNNCERVNYTHYHKDYFGFKYGSEMSRPVLRCLYLNSFAEFSQGLDTVVSYIDTQNNKILVPPALIDAILYTALMSVSSCYDLFKSGSRKTPGTFYEVLVGHLMSLMLPSYRQGKHIEIPGESEKITTDIVFDNGSHGIAIPVKITTRERIVQPFAHQRIINNVFGNYFSSVFIGGSETKLGKQTRHVDDICVPGTIKLFVNHLSEISGFYYLDPPARYMQEDMQRVVKVSTLGHLLNSDLSAMINPMWF
ncbi:type II site-specific deoxyribonuclease [Vibrio vulnificus]|uniref:Type II site-specific deoxyribonuclease n=1 Tax=Vibrio vulnificus TaxID=672 RepID=A0A2S3R6J5_VIBVL|nr:type II site-specific deoxyribonuclease [Vibrio vulnificus]POB49330.1 type II site-specific deoxyribonuclease [Vibrio vulnificus]